MAKYEYKPLPSDRDYIRLLTIQRGDHDDDIVIKLSVSPFDQHHPPRYEALSYCWGQRDDDGKVQMKSSSKRLLRHVFLKRNRDRVTNTLPISHSLEVALRHLRYADRPRVMWIDALCIDQSNDGEKSHQVGVMGAIYRLAHRVVVWLGPEENDSNRAMALMECVGSQVEVDWNSWSVFPTRGATDKTLADSNIEFPFGEDGLRIFKRASYFKWSNELLERVMSLKGFASQPQLLSLSSMRGYLGPADCSDPKDRVYAVLDLLKDDLGIIPDYALTAMQVYEDAVVRFVEKAGDLGILGQCRLQIPSVGPTWVPDWSAKFAPSLQNYRNFASATLTAWHEFHDAGVLRVAGISILSIEHFKLIQMEPAQCCAKIFAEMRMIVNWLASHGKLAPGNDMFDRLTRTLVGNRFEESFYPRISDTGLMPMDTCKQVLMQMMAQEYIFDDQDFTVFNVSGRSENVLNVMNEIGMEAHAFVAGDHMGLARGPVQKGDKIYVLLGCDCPLVLRPITGNKYLVVGECFMSEICEGEALLGPLPDHIRVVLHSQDRRWAFHNTTSGEIFYEDPRLASLPIDMTRYRQQAERNGGYYDIEPEKLRRPGFDIEYLDLL